MLPSSLHASIAVLTGFIVCNAEAKLRLSDFEDKNHPDGHRTIILTDVALPGNYETSTSSHQIMNPVHTVISPVIYGSDTDSSKSDFWLVGAFLGKSGDKLLINSNSKDRYATLHREWSGRLTFDFSGKKKRPPFELNASVLRNGNLRFEADGNEWVKTNGPSMFPVSNWMSSSEL